MKPQENSNRVADVTLNENELFENFVRGEAGIGAGRNPVMLMMSGFDLPGLDELFEEEIERCFDKGYHDSPSENLRHVLQEFEGICHNLRAIMTAFRNFRAEHAIKGDDDQIRYRVPSFEAEAA